MRLANSDLYFCDDCGVDIDPSNEPLCLHCRGFNTLQAERDAAQARVKELESQVQRLDLAMRNVRALALRLKKSNPEFAEHFLRFCTEAGVRGSVLRSEVRPAKDGGGA